MAVTLQDLRDIYYDILREPQDTGGGTSAYPLTLCDLHLNAAQQKIVGGRVINPLTKEEARKGELHFIKDDAFYENVPSISLDLDTTVGATILYSSDTSTFPATGALYIAGNTITYTGNTGTSFTGCSNVKYAHVAGTGVSILHALPTDYGSIINVTYKNKVKMQQKLFDDMFEDLNSYKGTPKNRTKAIGYYDQPYRIAPFYTIIDATYLLIFNYQDLNAQIRVRYERVMPDMSMTGPVYCAIDNDLFAKTTITYLAVAQTLFDRGEEARAGQLYSVAVSYIREMYSWYNDTDYEKISGTHYLTGKGKINI